MCERIVLCRGSSSASSSPDFSGSTAVSSDSCHRSAAASTCKRASVSLSHATKERNRSSSPQTGALQTLSEGALCCEIEVDTPSGCLIWSLSSLSRNETPSGRHVGSIESENMYVLNTVAMRDAKQQPKSQTNGE